MKLPQIPVCEREKNFDEVDMTLTAAEAIKEAHSVACAATECMQLSHLVPFLETQRLISKKTLQRWRGVIMKAWINDTEIEFKQGETLLQAAKRVGIFIPTLCAYLPLTTRQARAAYVWLRLNQTGTAMTRRS